MIFPQLPRLAVSSIDYPTGRDRFAWGAENEGVNSAVARLRPKGTWLNLCCGDGRYHSRILETAKHVHALDLDQSALDALGSKLSENERKRTTFTLHDVTKPLPYLDGTFDGVFCSASLHLFSPDALGEVCGEIQRILAPQGEALVDFSFSIRRELSNGALLVYPQEHQYTLDEAMGIFQGAWSQLTEIEVAFGSVPSHTTNLGTVAYFYFSSAFSIHVRKSTER